MLHNYLRIETRLCKSRRVSTRLDESARGGSTYRPLRAMRMWCIRRVRQSTHSARRELRLFARHACVLLSNFHRLALLVSHTRVVDTLAHSRSYSHSYSRSYSRCKMTTALLTNCARSCLPSSFARCSPSLIARLKTTKTTRTTHSLHTTLDTAVSTTNSAVCAPPRPHVISSLVEQLSSRSLSSVSVSAPSSTQTSSRKSKDSSSSSSSDSDDDDDKKKKSKLAAKSRLKKDTKATTDSSQGEEPTTLSSSNTTDEVLLLLQEPRKVSVTH